MTRSPLYIYLDQNKWIELSRRYQSVKNGGRYDRLVSRLLEAVSADHVRLPLSTWHLIETHKHGNRSRRRKLGQTMVLFGQGHTIATQSHITPIEIGNAIDRLFGSSGPPRSISVFGQGLHNLYPKLPATTDLRFLQRFIEGLATDESIAQVAHGVQCTAEDGAQKMGAIRRDISDLSKEKQRGAYLASITCQLLDHLAKHLQAVGSNLQDFLALDRERLEDFWTSIPTVNVEYELATERNAHVDRSIAPNDSRDIAFLAVAVPYCDIVVTEKFWVSLIRRKGLDAKYNTRVTNVLDDIVPMIDILSSDD